MFVQDVRAPCSTGHASGDSEAFGIEPWSTGHFSGVEEDVEEDANAEWSTGHLSAELVAMMGLSIACTGRICECCNKVKLNRWCHQVLVSQPVIRQADHGRIVPVFPA